MSKLLVGFCRADITPEEPVPLGGYSNGPHRYNQEIDVSLDANIVALSDGDMTMVFVTTDTTRTYTQHYEEMRKAISEKTGLPFERIMLTATHTHSGPALEYMDEPPMAAYIALFYERLAQGAADAIADLKEVTALEVGSIEATGLNFVKHYICHPENGEAFVYGDNFNDSDLTKENVQEQSEHTTQADPTMHLIRFRREGGRDVIMANWRAHAQLTGGFKKYLLSGDFPAAFRRTLEAQTGAHVTYLQGACGNINPRSRIVKENYTVDHLAYGARLAWFASRCLEENMRRVEIGQLQMKQVIYTGTVDHSMDAYAQAGAETWRYYAETGDRAGAMEKFGKEAGFHSVYHAGTVHFKSTLDKTMDLELDAVTIGEHVAFVMAPNELFDALSVHTEEHSPYEMTFTCCYANGHYFYLPSRKGFEYGCYEAETSRFVPGTGEEVSQKHLEMLMELKKNTL